MKKTAVFIVLFLLFAGAVWGQAEFTWTGVIDSTTWEEPGNWDCDDPLLDGNNYPGDVITRVDDIVTIDKSGTSTINITDAVTIKDLKIDSGSVVTITTGDDFEVTGILTNGGTLTFIGDKLSAGTLTNDGTLDLGDADLTVNMLANNGDLILTGSGTQSVTLTTFTGNGTVTFNGAGTDFAGLTAFHNLTIQTGDRNVASAITVSGDFTLEGGSLDAVSIVVTGTSNIAEDVTTTGNQTYGAVTLGNDVILTGTTVTLGAVTGNHSLTITGDGVFNNGGSGIGALIVNGTSGNFSLTGGTLDAASISVAGTSTINGDITATGAQTYTGAVTLGGTDDRTITSQNGNILFSSTLNSLNGIELLTTSGDITVGGGITAQQLTVKASGTVTVDTVNIDPSNTESEGENAAIYIKAANFVVTSVTANSIVPGGVGGQLCLDLGVSWTNTYNVVDGNENVRWHQHFIDLSTSHLVYGDLPASLDPLPPSGYVHIKANDVKTTFTLGPGNNVYINDADNTNTSGVSFNTSGGGFIQFSGTNKFEKITLNSGGAGGIKLVDTDITVKGGFELTHSEVTALSSNSPPGSGSSIKASNITLNGITAANKENLTLTSTTGNIASGSMGSGIAYLGDVAVNSANEVTLSGAIYANSISVTSTGTTTIGTDITTTGNQTYTGAVTLGGNVTLTGTTVTLGAVTGNNHPLKITGDSVLKGNINTGTGTQIYGAVTLDNDVTLTGTTVTLGAVTGGGNSLTITGNGTFNNGGTGIGDLSVSSVFNLASGSLGAGTVSVTGTSSIAGDITTTTTQTYGAVTLVGSNATRTLAGTTVTLGTITGGGNSLTITGNGVFSGGSGIGALIVNGTGGNFSLTGGTLSAASVNVGGTSSIAGNITTTTTQIYGVVTLVGTNATRTLAGTTVTLGTITGGGNSLTITGDGTFNNGGSGIGALIVNGTSGNFSLTGGTLDAASVSVTGISNIAGDITTEGAQAYTGAVIIDGSGSSSNKRIITSESGDILFSSTLDAAVTTRDRIELLATDGDITVSGGISAKQLIAKATGDVTVAEIIIDSSNEESEGLDAAIYIEADNFVVTPGTANSIVPGGVGGQLCLVLNKEWEDEDNVVDGPEDKPSGTLGARWHQHFVDLAGKHLVYGTEPSALLALDALTPGDYVIVPAGFIKTTFILTSGKNVYINDAVNTNPSGLVFITSGTGVIKFSGTNKFEKITVKSAAADGIYLVDTDITVKGDFELNNNEKLTLDTDSVSNKGASSIDAANITLNVIVAENEEKLTLSANEVTLSGAIHANSISVTSTGTTTIGADITTDSAQTYTGAVMLGGAANTLRTLTGTTVTLGAVTGNNHPLKITGNSVLKGDINTGTGTQTYGAVTLGNDVTLTTSTTVTLGAVTGNNHPLTITGNGTFSDGGTGINALSVDGNFSLTGGTLGAASVNVTGTSSIAGNITTTTTQTYTGAVMLGGTGPRTITSDNGSIEFDSTLTFTGGIITLSAADITIGGLATAQRLVVKAAGTVSVNAITVTGTGNKGETAAIYIEANTFVVTTTIPGSIKPGQRATSPWGQLCLNLQNKWEDPYNVIDGAEDTDPDNLTLTGKRWHQHIPPDISKGEIIYSFTEDSNGNGRLDRIRVQTNVQLNGDFSGFVVIVSDGYKVDETKTGTTKGFVLVSAPAPLGTGKSPFDDDSFYIYLIEEKAELDGGNTPSWSILKNTSLRDKNIKQDFVGDPAVDKNIIPIDTIPPRIAYTLTLPGQLNNKTQTYVQMSEPVVSSGGKVTAFFGGDNHEALPAVPANLGYLFEYTHPYSADVLANLKNIYEDSAPPAPTRTNGYFQMRDTIIDKGEKPNIPPENSKFPPKYPLNWGYTEYEKAGVNPVFEPPNSLLTVDMMIKLAKGEGVDVTPNNDPVIRRVTDILISMPPNTANDNYFVWPTFAKPSADNISIRDFDGTAYLEKDSIEKSGMDLQALINKNLAITPQLFWTATDIPDNKRNPDETSDAKKIGGLWLPNAINNPLYYYVPLSDGINTTSAANSSSPLFNITADKLANSGAKFEFIFRPSNTSDMFIARLDAAPNVIPDKWYTLIRPFGFNIQSIRYQRGGVTILNNVINSDKKENALIRYELTRSGRVTIQIYTLDGTVVKSIRRNEQRETGSYVDTWDGSNNGGRAVARGMYFVRVVGPDIDEIRKIMVVK